MIPRGIFHNPGSQTYGSVEAQVLAQLPLDRTEIARVIHGDSCGAVVTTENGRVVCLSWKEAGEFGIEPSSHQRY